MRGAENPESKSPEYAYVDGNGNRFLLTRDGLQYRPVEPAQSSSGLYSGGEPREKELSGRNFRRVSALLDEALGTPSIHLEHRVKGSGLVTVSTGSTEERAVLLPRCREQRQIEELLQSLLD